MEPEWPAGFDAFGCRKKHRKTLSCGMDLIPQTLSLFLAIPSRVSRWAGVLCNARPVSFLQPGPFDSSVRLVYP